MLEFLKFAEKAAEKIVVRSALNPLIWLGIVGGSILLAAGFTFSRVTVLAPYCGLLIHAAIVLFVAPALVGVGFAIFDSDKLQSESYQLRQHAMTVIQQMGRAPQIVDTASIVAIANPEPRQIEQGPEAREPQPEAAGDEK